MLIRPSPRVAILAPEGGALRAFLPQLVQAAQSCAGRAPVDFDPSRVNKATAEAVTAARPCLPLPPEPRRLGPRRLGPRRLVPPGAGDEKAPDPAFGDQAITLDLWRALAPETPPPDMLDRARAMTLSFEATPFARPPIWNLCQDVPGDASARALAVAGGEPCRNKSDPCALLTWGPRGATAGYGREAQWILWRLEREAPTSLDRAFGALAPQVRRLARLAPPPIRGCDGSSDLEAALCRVWIEPELRARWDAGFRRLGRDPQAWRAFDGVYALEEFDGYKLRAYRALWRALDLEPSEIDFAFFFDRATHIGAPPAGAEADLRACLAAETSPNLGEAAMPATRNAAARRCLSRAHRHRDAPVDRLGRDMAYYRGAYAPEALTEQERRTWERHIPLDAAFNFGLSDHRPAPASLFASRSAMSGERPPFAGAAPTVAEIACGSRLWPR